MIVVVVVYIGRVERSVLEYEDEINVFSTLQSTHLHCKPRDSPVTPYPPLCLTILYVMNNINVVFTKL